MTSFNPQLPSSCNLPRSFNPYPLPPHFGSLSGRTTPIPITGPSFPPPAPFSPPSFFDSGSPQGRTDRFTSLPVTSGFSPNFSTSYPRTSSNKTFHQLNIPSPCCPPSLAIISLPPSSLSSLSFHPPSLYGKAHWISPSSSNPQGTLPSRNQGALFSLSIERSPFPPHTLEKMPGIPSFSLHYQTSFSSFEGQLQVQQSVRRQFEETMKMVYEVNAPPERPFPVWNTINVTQLIFPQMSIFIDRLALTKLFQSISSVQNPSNGSPSIPSAAPPNTNFWSQVGCTVKYIIVKDLVHPGIEAYGWIQSQLAQTGETFGLNSQSFKERMAEVHTDVQQKHETIGRFFGTEYAAAYNPQLQKLKQKIGLESVNLFIPFGPSLAGKVALVKSSNIELKALPIIQQKFCFKNVPLALREAKVLERTRVLEATAQNVILYQHPEKWMRIRLNGVWELKGSNIKSFDIWRVIDQEGKWKHLFEGKHNFHQFNCPPQDVLSQVTKAVIDADRLGNIPKGQDFRIRVLVKGTEIEARGIVIDGELRYGTIFIPKK